MNSFEMNDESTKTGWIARWTHRIAALSLALALGLIVLVLVSGPGFKAGFWNFMTGISLMRTAATFSTPVLILAVLSTRGSTLRMTIPAALLCLLILGGGLYWKKRVEAVPRIHDISTDTLSPPEFIAIAPLRADSPNPAAYAGQEVAALQKAAYPDLKTLELGIPARIAFERALSAAKSLGWEIVASESGSLPYRIEATDTTAWFGFKDDIVIRITSSDPAGDAPDFSRLDVRSKSRVGLSDVGTNAQRIRKFQAIFADYSRN